jgi:hypothetical protein
MFKHGGPLRSLNLVESIAIVCVCIDDKQVHMLLDFKGLRRWFIDTQNR